MSRSALEQAVEMLEAKAEQGHLSPEDERRVRELLAEGDARRALESLTRRTVDEEAELPEESEFELADDEEFDYAD